MWCGPHPPCIEKGTVSLSFTSALEVRNTQSAQELTALHGQTHYNTEYVVMGGETLISLLPRVRKNAGGGEGKGKST